MLGSVHPTVDGFQRLGGASCFYFQLLQLILKIFNPLVDSLHSDV